MIRTLFIIGATALPTALVSFRAGKAIERANGLMRTALFMERAEHEAAQR